MPLSMLRLVPAHLGFAMSLDKALTTMGLISTLFLAASLATLSIYFRRLSNETPAKAS